MDSAEELKKTIIAVVGQLAHDEDVEDEDDEKKSDAEDEDDDVIEVAEDEDDDKKSDAEDEDEDRKRRTKSKRWTLL